MNKQDLKKRIISSPLKRLYFHYIYWGVFCKEHDAIKSLILKIPPSERPSMLRMWWVMVVKLWIPEEYMSFRYELLSKKGRKQYVLNWEKDVFALAVNNDNVHNLFDDKYGTYLYFKEFFKRDVIQIDFLENNLNDISAFFCKHPKAIVKRNKGGSGHGVAIVDVNDYDSVESLYNDLQKKYNSKKIVLEEIIQQDSRLACFHPQSVNTLRMSAIRLQDDIVLFHPGMRFGQGASIVDNGGLGGILTAIDVDTGIIRAAATEDGKDYFIHPDTKKLIIGYQVPMWEEAQRFTKELMGAFPEGIYISWDLALTEKGWVMVEGNSRGQLFIQQLPMHRGVRNEFEEIKKKLGV